YPPEFQLWHILSTAGATIQGFGFALPVFYLTGSLFFGAKAGPNPWRATGLEWQTGSPPGPHNFYGTPVVYYGPYEYAIPNGLKDHLNGVNGHANGTNGHAKASAASQQGAH
ncbi:MAG: hypothetical protein ACRC7O_01305, partial [Fimbriiglobus sp.]